MGQAAIKNGAVAGSNSAVIDLAAFNTKAAITAALQHIENAEQALHTAESSTQGLIRSLHKAKQSLKKAWEDTQKVSFVNTGVKHTSIAIADGGRAVHASFDTLRAQALRVGTGSHGHSLDALTKDIPITSSSLFGGDLGKAVGKTPPLPATTGHWGTILSCLASLGPSPPEARSRRQTPRRPFMGKTGPDTARAAPRNPAGSGRGSGHLRAG